MHRLLAAACAACGLIVIALRPEVADAQQWNDVRSRALVERAAARRAQQLADTGLKDFKAIAHGYVTFLAQVGEGLTEPPKVVKADELVNEVYWLTPDLSKQRIVGRRDTLLLPTDISYHRDHLGIVQNNFPAVIRLGDGDEVRDVPHPLSDQGLDLYDYAITDSLGFQLPGRTIQVLEVKIRPRDARQPRIIGAMYIDRDDAQVVRMAFNFTRAAFLDRALEDLFVVIENSLVSGRFWLPRRQEIEIRRGGTWLDYPVRGIIRGRWEIGDYAVNTGLERSFFAGPEIVLAPKAVRDTFRFGGRILDSLPPDVRVVTGADVRQVQQEARALVRAQALRRPQRLLLSSVGVSDVVRYNRAEGFALGAGVASRFGGGLGAQVRARYGFDDHRAKAIATLDWRSANWGVRLFGMDDFRDMGDVQERSRLINSIAAQEFGSDVSAPYGVRAVGAGVDAADVLGLRWKLDVSAERHRALVVRARPARGTFAPLVEAAALRGTRASLVAERPTSLSFFGTEVRVLGELRLSGLRAPGERASDAATGSGTTTSNDRTVVGRAFASVWAERPFDRGRLAVYLAGGGVRASGAVPAQEQLYLGGPTSAPGYRFQELAAGAAATARVEWRAAVPAPSFSLGRFGRIPGQATVAPFVQGTYARPVTGIALVRAEGIYPSVGIGLQPVYDLLRLQLARGLRGGRWSFNLDVSREFWGIL